MDNRVFRLIKEKKYIRAFWAWLYIKGIYKAKLIPDGKRNTRRAMQTLLDVEGYLRGGDNVPAGTYRTKGKIYLEKNMRILGSKKHKLSIKGENKSGRSISG